MPHKVFNQNESDTPHSNGVATASIPAGSNRRSASNLSNGVVTPHKRPKTVDMDESEEPVAGPSISPDPTRNQKRTKKTHMTNGFAKTSVDLLEQRKQLPIWKGKRSLVSEVQSNDTVVILGETGCGKTTQVPQFLLEANIHGSKKIAITQPRRVAATSLAVRVAKEQGSALGSLVGYAVRFDENHSPETKIKYMTDGMIMRELLMDPTLSNYNVIIVDEAHERTLRTDMLLSSLKAIQKKRNSATTGTAAQPRGAPDPLKVIIMSATLDAERFSKFFDNAKILYVEGRQHTVEIKYAHEPQTDYIEAAMRTFFQIHLYKPPGDVLIFLSGQEEIESLQASIKMYSSQLKPDKMDISTHPLYAALPQGQQQVFQPARPNTRKCILATNIAETSITIPGVKYVIDTGVCKEKSYQAPKKGSGVDALVVKPISKSSAGQRAGRAGREGPGECYRLYTEDAYNEFRESPIPEIQRCNLMSAVLDMKCLGQSPETVDLMDQPDHDTIRASLICLFGLEALDKTGKITPLGKTMSRFPLLPPYSRALLASKDHSCTLEVIQILSILSASSKVLVDSASEGRDAVAEARSKFRHTSGDHMTLLNVLRAYNDISTSTGAVGSSVNKDQRDWCQKNFVNERALKESEKVADQLSQLCTKMGINPRTSAGEDSDPILRSLLSGSFNNTAMIQPDGSYRQILGGTPVKIHPSSSMFGRKVPAIMYDELIITSGTFARTVSHIQNSWVMQHPFIASAKQ